MKQDVVFVDPVVTLKSCTCGECGVAFAMPKKMYETRLADGRTFYCPNGHPRGFVRGQTEADRLRKMLEEANRSKTELVAANQHLADSKNALWDEKKKVEVQLKRTKTIAKKVTDRIHAGVCPCCTRTFANLARHMQTKHKDATPT